MDKPIRYSNLYMEIPAAVLEISQMEVTEELNEHGMAQVTLMTEEEDEYELLNKLNASVSIKLVFVLDEEEPVVIFVGMPTQVTIKSIGHVFYVKLTLKSKSFVLDWEKKRRSFQNKDNPYTNLFKKVVEEDNDYHAAVTDLASKGALQDESIIQYEETDWEFVKRLASKLKAKIITNVREPRPIITIGKQRGFDYKQETVQYAITNEAGEYLKAQMNYDNWEQEQKIYFTIESMNEYKLYDKILYNDIRLTVVKKKTSLDKGIIVFTYWLLKETGVRQDLLVNSKILGASIDGKVLDITTDRVKLHLSIDKEQPIEEAYWYKYETAYTTEGRTGFYSMPQKGDDVKLYIPKDNMEEGYVRTVNRLDGESNPKTQNPKVKYYGNIHKKELMLAPTELQVTTTNGMILLNMDVGAGIEITSSDNVLIKTDAEGIIDGKSIALRAKNDIWLATKTSSITIDTEINMKADGNVVGI